MKNMIMSNHYNKGDEFSVVTDVDAVQQQQQQQQEKEKGEKVVVDPSSVLKGVICSRSIRSRYAVFHMAVSSSSSSLSSLLNYVLVRIQFFDKEADDHDVIPKLRSWCRRCCNLGDHLELTSLSSKYGYVSNDNASKSNKRFIINLMSLKEANESLKILEDRKWGMKQCQVFQEKWLGNCFERKRDRSKSRPKVIVDSNLNGMSGVHGEEQRHSSVISKREQGEIVSQFLIAKLSNKFLNEKPSISEEESRIKAIEQLNSGSGVIDAAGGSGHVSMALGMAGIKSTVVDPRQAVGKLPSRDRKIWYRSLRNQNKESLNDSDMTCIQCNSNTIPYSVLRAWFGSPPSGVNASYRHPDSDVVEVCSLEHQLVENCSAIVALHPDEATDAIVSVAIRRKVPFVIVPCCVFARLFPYRQMKSGGNVSTYSDLLEYIAYQDISIKRTLLDFDGANVALWSTF